MRQVLTVDQKTALTKLTDHRIKGGGGEEEREVEGEEERWRERKREEGSCPLVMFNEY